MAFCLLSTSCVRSRAFLAHTSINYLACLQVKLHTSAHLIASTGKGPHRSTSSEIAEAAYNQIVDEGGPHKLNSQFSDGKIAFASKTTAQLFRGMLVYNLCSINYLVNNNKQIMKACRKIFGATIFNAAMKATFYGHFVAGEDKEKIKPLVLLNRQFGVKSILDYSVEEDIPEDEAKQKVKESLEEVLEGSSKPRANAATTKYQTSLEFADRSKQVTSARTFFYESEVQCDKNRDIFLKCIDAVSGSTRKEGFGVIKLTALGRPQLLLQMSDILVQLQNFFVALSTDDKSVLDPDMQTVDMAGFKSHLNNLGVRIQYDATTALYTLMMKQEDGSEIDLLEWNQLLSFSNNLARVFTVKNVETESGETIKRFTSNLTDATEQLVPTLTEEGLLEMRLMMKRIDQIAKHAKEQDCRVMVDAEQSYFQPAIRRIAMELMRKYNKDSNIIFNTYQCYLKDAMTHVSQDLGLAEREDFFFGAKVVRGAYMEQERARSAQLGYEDPINPNFESTTAMYEAVMEKVFSTIEKRPKGKVAVMVASHNEDTVRYAVRKMDEHGIKPSDRVICFGQLLGMCDQISFSLGHAGYSVYKYVPYGPIEGVLPYLSRRALENKGILAKVKKERSLLAAEIRRRIRHGEIFHDPLVNPPLPPLPMQQGK